MNPGRPRTWRAAGLLLKWPSVERARGSTVIGWSVAWMDGSRHAMPRRLRRMTPFAVAAVLAACGAGGGAPGQVTQSPGSEEANGTIIPSLTFDPGTPDPETTTVERPLPTETRPTASLPIVPLGGDTPEPEDGRYCATVNWLGPDAFPDGVEVQVTEVAVLPPTDDGEAPAASFDLDDDCEPGLAGCMSAAPSFTAEVRQCTVTITSLDGEGRLAASGQASCRDEPTCETFAQAVAASGDQFIPVEPLVSDDSGSPSEPPDASPGEPSDGSSDVSPDEPSDVPTDGPSV